MRRLLLALAFLLAAPAGAQLLAYDATNRPSCTDGKPRIVWLLNESSATDCDATAGGAFEALCCCTEGAWAACTPAPTVVNSFATIDAPQGTDPVADSSADTLTIIASPTGSVPSGIEVTGDSAADTLSISLTDDCAAGEVLQFYTTPSRWLCTTPFTKADIDTSSELRMILTDETGTDALMFGLTTAMADDLGCAAYQSVQRNYLDSTWQCYTPLAAASEAYTPAVGAAVPEAAYSIWVDGATPAIMFEGVTVDAYETILFAAEATGSDKFFSLPNQTGYAMISDCSTCYATAANGVMGTTNGFLFEGTTANGFETTFLAGDATADRTVTLPNSSGTLVTALLQQGVLLGSLIGANFNTTGDNAITLVSTDYIIDDIIVTNASTSLSPAAGGVYSAATKGGTVYVAAAQSYAALTGSTVVLKLTLAAAASNAHRTGGTIYLSLTTARGAAATADIYVFGTRWN